MYPSTLLVTVKTTHTTHNGWWCCHIFSFDASFNIYDGKNIPRPMWKMWGTFSIGCEQAAACLPCCDWQPTDEPQRLSVREDADSNRLPWKLGPALVICGIRVSIANVFGLFARLRLSHSKNSEELQFSRILSASRDERRCNVSAVHYEFWISKK